MAENNLITREEVLYNLKRAKKYFDSLKEFLVNISHMPYAMIKGEVLSINAYGKNGYRNYYDIDFLVHRENLGIFTQRLMEHGFVSPIISRDKATRVFYLSSSHQIWNFSKKFKGDEVNVDVNFDIFWGEYEGKRIDVNLLLKDTVENDIFGNKVKTLSLINSLIHLCLHHYKDLNSIFLISQGKSHKFNAFRDVYSFIKNNRCEITERRLYNICESMEIMPYIYYIIYYTNILFPDDDLKKYAAILKTEKGEALLNKYGLCENEQKEWPINFISRLNHDNLFSVIESGLTDKDIDKINMNKKYFLNM